MAKKRSNKNLIVLRYAQMWPRAVFDIKEGNQFLGSVRESLNAAGVYVLYRDDHPYYIGKTTGALFNRILEHANHPYDRYYNFWNYFSAYVAENPEHIDELEGILIAAMPTAVNSANPRIQRISLPNEVARILRKARQRALE